MMKERPRGGGEPPRWHYVYFVLAALELSSAPGRGTAVKASFPIYAEAAV